MQRKAWLHQPGAEPGGINKPITLHCTCKRGIKGIRAFALTLNLFFFFLFQAAVQIEKANETRREGSGKKIKGRLIKFLHRTKNDVPEDRNISG